MAVLALTAGGAALAQEPAAGNGIAAATESDTAATDQRADIVVTGTRITSSGFQAPTPVTVVTGEQLQLAAPTSIPSTILSAASPASTARSGRSR